MMISTNKMNRQFQWFIWVNETPPWECKIIKMKIFEPTILEGWWYTGRKTHQFGAEWAVHASWYLQKSRLKDFQFGDFSCPQISHRHCMFILFVQIIIAMRGGQNSYLPGISQVMQAFSVFLIFRQILMIFSKFRWIIKYCKIWQKMKKSLHLGNWGPLWYNE